MQIKLSEVLAKRFEGKSPEEIIAAFTAATEPKPEISLATLEQLQALESRVTSLPDKGQVQQLAAQVAVIETRLAAVTTECRAEAGRMIAEAIAKSGLAAPVGGAPAAPAPEPEKKPGKEFQDLVAAKIAAGATKGAAVLAATRENPKAYEAWRAAGGTPL